VEDSLPEQQRDGPQRNRRDHKGHADHGHTRGKDVIAIPMVAGAPYRMEQLSASSRGGLAPLAFLSVSL
jgi:hypothetical protein